MNKCIIPRKFQFFIFSIFSLLCIIQNKNIILPFDQLIEKNKNSSPDYDIYKYFIDSINNKMHFKFQTVKPEQTITCISKTEDNDISIKFEKCIKKEGENYDPIKSSTCVNITKINGSKFYILNEEIILNENNQKQKTYNIQLNFEGNCHYCEVNLLMNANSKIEEIKKMFISQLKQKHIIDYLILSIDYLSNQKGNIYLGNYPHLFEKSPFKKWKFYNIKSHLSLNNNDKFKIYMNSMYFLNKFGGINRNNIIDFTIREGLEFIYDSDFIFANAKFINNIEYYFFKQYIEKKMCFFNTINIDGHIYIIYDCIKTPYSPIKIQDFPTINFYHKDLNFTFKLTYEDLFEEINDKYYFLIVYDLKSTDTWKLGKPFLKKYNFVFNAENKTMGFYDKNNIINAKDNDISKRIKIFDIKNLNKNSLIIMFVFINILLIVLIITMKKNGKKKRKNKINELKDENEEEYHEFESKNFDSNIIINSS